MNAKIITLLVLAISYCIITGGCAQILMPLGWKDCAPVYGNWCGERYPLDGFDPEPVDEWDSACQTHDHCYEKAQGNEKKKTQCDDAFLKDMQSLYQSGHPVPQEMRNAYEWFGKSKKASLFIWAPAKDTWWSMFANCEGGDGRPAQFCVHPGPGRYCEMAKDWMPGWSCACYTPMGVFAGTVVQSE